MSPVEYLILILICLLFLAVLVGILVFSWYVLFHFVERNLRRCPNCRRVAGTIVNSETEPLGTQFDRTGKELVRVKSEKVTDNYRCESCNHTWTRSFERQERTPVRGTPAS